MPDPVPEIALPTDIGWLRRIGPRLRALWPAKLIGIPLGMAAFFAVYFQLLRHPVFPVTTVPLIAIDRVLGFRPEALPLYASLWIYVSLAPGLMVARRQLVSYGLAALLLSSIGFGIFFFLPTAVPGSGADWSSHPSFALLKAADASGNACPSMHVAFAVFTAVWLGRLLRETGAGRPVRALNWAWCLGIVYSTLAIRQHVALDALSGAALGAAVAAANLHHPGARPRGK